MIREDDAALVYLTVPCSRSETIVKADSRAVTVLGKQENGVKAPSSEGGYGEQTVTDSPEYKGDSPNIVRRCY